MVRLQDQGLMNNGLLNIHVVGFNASAKYPHPSVIDNHSIWKIITAQGITT